MASDPVFLKTKALAAAKRDVLPARVRGAATREETPEEDISDQDDPDDDEPDEDDPEGDEDVSLPI